MEFQNLSKQLKRTYLTYKLLIVLKILFQTTFAALLFSALVFVGDYYIHFSNLLPFRLALIAILFIGIWQILRHLLRPLNEEKIAIFLEQRFPQLQDSLISAVQLSRHRSQYVSSALVEKTIQHACKLCQNISFQGILPWKSFFFALFCASVLASIFYFLAPTQLTSIFLDRFLYAKPISWPSKVYLELDYPTQLRQGDIFYLNAKVIRGNVEKVECFIQENNQQTYTLPMERITQKHTTVFTTKRPMLNSFSFYVKAGDYTSPTITIPVKVWPTLSLFYKRIYPNYLKKENDKKFLPTWGKIELYWGSTLFLQGRTNKPIQKAYLKITPVISGKKYPPKLYKNLTLTQVPEEQYTLVQITLKTHPPYLYPNNETPPKTKNLSKNPPPNAQFQLTFHLTDKDGLHNKNPETFLVSVQTDFPPQAEFRSPSPEEEIYTSPQGKLNLSAEAWDDFELKHVALYLQLWEKTKIKKETKLPLYLPPGEAKVELKQTIDFQKLSNSWEKLKDGEKIFIYLEASDSKGNQNKSLNRLEVQILSVEKIKNLAEQKIEETAQHLQKALQELRPAQSSLLKVATSESFLQQKLSSKDEENLSIAQDYQEEIQADLEHATSLLLQGMKILKNNRLPHTLRGVQLLPVYQKLHSLLRLASHIGKQINFLLSQPHPQELKETRKNQKKLSKQILEILDELKKEEGWTNLIMQIQEIQKQQEILEKKTGNILKNNPLKRK